MSQLLIFMFLTFAWVGFADAQMCSPERMRCPTTAPYPEPTITEGNTFRTVQTTGCPPYGQGWTNPAQACIQDITYNIPLNPMYATTPIPTGQIHSTFNNINYLLQDPQPILGALGVFVNGVKIFGVGSPCGFSSDCPSDGTGAPTMFVDAVQSEGHTVDDCGGHASPTNEYHIHSGIGINSTSQRVACGLPVDRQGEHSELLGWMFDGFGIYGRYSQGGRVPTELDSCGGHTHEIDGVSIYHYHIPDEFPWIIGCFKGCSQVSNNQMQLGFANNGNYGCPEGLTVDPDPVIEPVPGAGVKETVSKIALMAVILLSVAMLP